jgi:hypothetical protein
MILRIDVCPGTQPTLAIPFAISSDPYGLSLDAPYVCYASMIGDLRAGSRWISQSHRIEAVNKNVHCKL